MPELSEKEIQRQSIVENIDLCKESHKSSSEEFDKQLVYIAGGGLVLTIGFVKDIVTITTAQHLWILLTTWVCFTLTLFFNLFSHKLANTAADESLTLWNYRKYCLDFNQKPSEEHEAKIERKMNRANNWVHRLNTICIVVATIAVLFFIIFTYSNLHDAKPAGTKRLAATAAAPSDRARPNQGANATVTSTDSVATTGTRSSGSAHAIPSRLTSTDSLTSNKSMSKQQPTPQKPDEIRGQPLPSVVTTKPMSSPSGKPQTNK